MPTASNTAFQWWKQLSSAVPVSILLTLPRTRIARRPHWWLEWAIWASSSFYWFLPPSGAHDTWWYLTWTVLHNCHASDQAFAILGFPLSRSRSAWCKFLLVCWRGKTEYRLRPSGDGVLLWLSHPLASPLTEFNRSRWVEYGERLFWDQMPLVLSNYTV